MLVGQGKAPTSNQKTIALTIPEWKWEEISMDFIMGFPMTSRKHDFIMVVVDKLNKVVHFIELNMIHINQALENNLQMKLSNMKSNQ